MSDTRDRIVLRGMRFRGHHGLTDRERADAQDFEVDVEVPADLSAAGATDEIGDTVDYGPLHEICRAIVEETQLKLLEAMADAIATRILSTTGATEVTVRVRKMQLPSRGPIDYAGVEIRRTR